MSEANGLWNDPKISAQLWHGLRLWFAIKLALFGIAVVRVLPALLLCVFLIGGDTVGLGLYIAANSNNIAKTTAATVPYRGAIPEVSEISDVYVGTKVKRLAYNTAPIPGEVTARNINSISIEWQDDGRVVSYSNEQLARAFKSGVIVITAI